MHPSASREQVVEFGNDIWRDNEGTRIGLDGRAHVGTVGITRIEVREEAARIANEHWLAIAEPGQCFVNLLRE